MTQVNMSGPQAFAELIRAHQVSHAFFVPAILQEGLPELGRIGVRSVSAHGEKAAAYMADGYARASGRPGVCMSQTVGASNLAAGLKDAYLSCSPVVAITGGTYVESRYRQVYQEIRDSDMFGPVTKWNAEVEVPRRLPDVLGQAFRVATTGAPGPVHVEMRGHLGQLGVGTREQTADFDVGIDRRFGQVPPFRPEAEPAAVAEAGRELSRAQRPVIIAGGGVMWSRAERELAELADKLSIPVATSLHAKAALAESNPLNVGFCGVYSRACANRVVAEADLVLFVGSQTGSMITTQWQVPAPGTRIIHLDIDPQQLGRHYPTAVALNGDAKATLRRLIDGVDERSNPIWLDRVQTLVAQWRSEVADLVESDASPMRPERIAAEIGKALPADGAAVIDTLQASVWAGSHMQLQGPSQRFIRCAGSLGWSLPAAIGAQCALGVRRVVCFTGDGGFYYHLAELETAARYGIPVVVVINNNGAYGVEGPSHTRMYSDRGPEGIAEGNLSWTFSVHDFAQLARDFGCEGIRVESPRDLGSALRQALSSGKPAVIDAISDPSAIHPKAWVPTALAYA